MPYWILREDFDHTAIQAGHLEAALDDAWEDFGPYNGSMIQFFAARKKTHPHRYKADPVDTTGDPALYSVDEQTKHARLNGVDATRELLAAHDLKLGQVLKAKSEGDSLTDSTNPYSDKFKGTAKEKSDAIARLLKKGGTKLVLGLATPAGKTIDGLPLHPVGAARMQRR